MPLLLAAWVVGVALLQWQADLPAALDIAFAVVSGAVLLGGAIALRRVGVASAAVQAFAAAGCLALGFGYAALLAQARWADALDPADQGVDLAIEGVIDSLPARSERGWRFELAVTGGVDAARVPARVLLGWYAPAADPKPGERWALVVRLRRPHAPQNPGTFDAEAWMLEQGVRAQGYVRSARLQHDFTWRFGTVVDRVRWGLRARLQQTLEGHAHGGVLIALVLGDQRAISEADWQLFARTGISHLVSISGLHITMIAALGAWAAGALWRRSRNLLPRAPLPLVRAAAALVCALLYALLAGWGVPAQRTFFMLATVAVLVLARRRTDAPGVLAAAAAVVMLLDPWAALAPGFWLSFGAVAVIFWIVLGRPAAPVATRVHARAGSLLHEGARVQMAITVGLLPLTAALFQQLSLVSPLANAVAIPLVSWLVAPLALLGALLVILPGPLGWLARGPLALADALFGALHGVLEALARWPAASVGLPLPDPWWTLLALAGAAWLCAPPGWPLRALGLVWMLPLLVWPAARPASGELWITAIDVGQGAAVLLQAGRTAWLYDTGPRYGSDADAGARIVLPTLRARGVTQLDGLVVSHLDSDHSGGARSVLAHWPDTPVLTSMARDHPALAPARRVERCMAGQTLESGALRIEVVHPTADNYNDSRRSPNAMSCVVRVRAGGLTALLTGDLPAVDEQALVARAGALAADWLLVPHHGSRTSSSPALLAAVAPRWAAVQAGYRNRFGHPHGAVLARYAERGIALARTDGAGALQWRLRADGVAEVLAWRSVARRYWFDRAASPADLALAAQPSSDDAGDLAPVEAAWPFP